MSWYNESLNNLLKKHEFNLESSKMPCVRFSRQQKNETPNSFRKKTQKLEQLSAKEEPQNESV